METHIRNNFFTKDNTSLPNDHLLFEDELNKVRNGIFDAFLSVFVGVSFFLLLLSYTRIFYFGWSPVYIFHTLLVVYFLVVYVKKNTISFEFKFASFVSLFFIIGFLGVFSYGINGSWECAFMTSSTLIALFYNQKYSIYFTAIVGVFLLGSGALFVFEVVGLPLHSSAYAKTVVAWVSTTFFVVFFCLIINFFISKYHVILKNKVMDLFLSEYQLKSYQEQLAGILEATPTPLMILDKEFRILKLNKAFESLFGYEQGAFLTLQEFFIKTFESEDMARISFHALEDDLHSREVKYGFVEAMPCSTFKMYDGKGNPITIETSATVTKDQVLLNLRNISEQVTYEKKLLAQEQDLKDKNRAYRDLVGSFKEKNEVLNKTISELEKANHELDSFVYRVSHDLRAPITSSLGLCAVAKLDPDPKEMRGYIDLQEKSLKKLDSFIKDILDYSRNSRVDVSFDTLNIKMLVKEVVESLALSVEKGVIELDMEFNEEIFVKSDPLRVRIILTNLISNAFKFYDDQKEQPFIRILTHGTADGLKIEVIDNGIGIKEEHYQRIFEMFYRATEKTSGSGIGLYIVFDCVHKLGGTLDFFSEYGQGTSFTINLPLQVLEKKEFK